MFEGEEGQKRPRDRRKVRDQVAEQVAGFANAEGGVSSSASRTTIASPATSSRPTPSRHCSTCRGFACIPPELTDVEFRALLEAHRAGRLDNARLRAISGLDTLGASALLRRLRDRALLALHAAGPNSYYELGPKAQLPVDAQGLEADRPEPTSDRPESKADRPELTADRPESAADRPEVPPDLAAAVKALGTRPRQGPLRDVIASLCSWRPLKPAELGSILGIRADNLTKRHLTEMVTEGRLRRLFPDEPTHPNQAYAAAADDDEKSPT